MVPEILVLLCEGVYSVYILDNQACLDSIIVEVFAQSVLADATIGPVVNLMREHISCAIICC